MTIQNKIYLDRIRLNEAEVGPGPETLTPTPIGPPNPWPPKPDPEGPMEDNCKYWKEELARYEEQMEALRVWKREVTRQRNQACRAFNDQVPIGSDTTAPRGCLEPIEDGGCGPRPQVSDPDYTPEKFNAWNECITDCTVRLQNECNRLNDLIDQIAGFISQWSELISDLRHLIHTRCKGLDGGGESKPTTGITALPKISKGGPLAGGMQDTH